MIEEIAAVLKIAKSAIELGKEAKSLLPNDEKKKQIESKLGGRRINSVNQLA